MVYNYISADPCMSMHEAKWSRAEVAAGKRRPEDGSLRAAISNASCEGPSRPRQASSTLGTLRLQGRLERPFLAFCASGTIRAAQRARAVISSAPAATGQDRAAISSAMGQVRAAALPTFNDTPYIM